MSACKIKFLPYDREAVVEDGATLLDAARLAGVPLRSACGGEGTCGKCRLIVRKGRVDAPRTALLSEEEIAQGYVLACQARPLDDELVVEAPPEARLDDAQALGGEQTDRPDAGLHDIETVETEEAPPELAPLVQRREVELAPPTLDDTVGDLERLVHALNLSDADSRSLIGLPRLRELPALLRSGDWRASVCVSRAGGQPRIVRVQPAGSKANFGLAVDIGTTTVVAQLVDLNTGEVLGAKGVMNAQAGYGDDVISRIIQACEFDRGKKLHEAVIRNINDLAAALCAEQGVDASDIHAAACAGNATMAHLLLGLSPCSIRLEPFVCATNSPPTVEARELGLRVWPEAPVVCLPSVSGFVGGDIVAGILATGLDQAEDLCVLIDIGTNGEIVVGNRDWMLSCSSSAGPAFEGSGIVSGVRAVRGAIQSVTIDPETCEPSYRTIGDAPPVGICGSGLVDLTAQLFLRGILDRSGRFQRVGEDARVRPGSDYGPEYVVVDAAQSATRNDIVFTEVDARNLIRSKGAILTALLMLVEKVGVPLSDVKRFFVAGGFGAYLHIRHAITIGLLPDLPEERFQFVGNTSLAGARRALLSVDEFARARRVVENMSYFELSADPDFMDRYVASLFLPHTDASLFPSVQA